MPQTFTCDNPACAKEFTAAPSDRVRAHRFCSLACAAAFAHQQRGHGGKITKPCPVCATPVTRYASQQTGHGEHFYCSRAHFYERGRHVSNTTQNQ